MTNKNDMAVASQDAVDTRPAKIHELKLEQAEEALQPYEARSIYTDKPLKTKAKSDNDIVIEAMTARIRELEQSLETQARELHEKSEAAHEYHSATALAFAHFILDKSDVDEFLAFEQHIDSMLARFSKFQPDVLNAYLWVFEMALDDVDGLINLDERLDKVDFDRIAANVEKYNEQLLHWEKTGEAPINPRAGDNNED